MDEEIYKSRINFWANLTPYFYANCPTLLLFTNGPPSSD